METQTGTTIALCHSHGHGIWHQIHSQPGTLADYDRWTVVPAESYGLQPGEPVLLAFLWSTGEVMFTRELPATALAQVERSPLTFGQAQRLRRLRKNVQDVRDRHPGITDEPRQSE